MTILECVNLVKFISHRGSQSVTTDQTTTDILNCMNQAWSDLARLIPRDAFRFDGPDLSTVIGTSTYTLSGYSPSVFEFIQWWYTDSNNGLYLLERIPSEREFYSGVLSPNAPNNKPTCYLPVGYDQATGNRKIQFYPTPDAVYTLHNSYYADLTSVDFKTYSLSANVPYLPSYLQQPLWKGTLYYYLRGFDDVAMIAQAKADYEESQLEQETAAQEARDEDTVWRLGVPQNTNPNRIRLT